MPRRLLLKLVPPCNDGGWKTGLVVQKKGAKAPSVSNKVFAYSVVGVGDNAKWDRWKRAIYLGSVGVCGSDLVVILHGTIIHSNSLSCFYIGGAARNQH